MAQAKHTAADLKQMQSLPLSAKILMTKRRIREWYDHWDGQVYVSFSGGKDSTVLKHLVDSMFDDVPAVFVNTGLEYPEIQQFVREVKTGKYECFNPDVEIIRPEMRFDEVIKTYGYPVISKDIAECIYWAKRGSITRLARLNGTQTKKDGSPSMFNCSKWKFMMEAPFESSAQCCNVMKKKPTKQYERMTGRKTILGLMACESIKRRDAWMHTGCNAYQKGRQQSQPMAFWTEQDVLHYIKAFNVPLCTAYGEIRVKPVGDQVDGQMNMIDELCAYDADDTLETTKCDRTGCMFGVHLEKEPNRFQRMKQTHPKQYEYCMNQLGLKEVLEYIGVPYE